jgi:GNAT superfamily N-acetyltransferase
MLSIRPATADDARLLARLIRELAEYERELEQVTMTEADLLKHGFGKQAKFRALIVEWNGEVAGYALFFGFYSTWAGRPGLFLEDLFVRPQFRGHGIGKAVLAHLAKLAREEECFGMRWEVLDWNKPAIDFYNSLGAIFLDNWKAVLLTGEPFEQLADKAA